MNIPSKLPLTKVRSTKIGSRACAMDGCSDKKMLLMLECKMPHSGKIVQWEYYRSAPVIPIIASVWRPLNNENSYRLIGENELVPSNEEVGVQQFEVNEADRIHAQEGDIVGIYYSQYVVSGAIACSVELVSSDNQIYSFQSKKESDGQKISDFNDENANLSSKAVQQNVTNISSVNGKVIQMDLYEDDVSVGSVVELDKNEHSYHHMTLALQAVLSPC